MATSDSQRLAAKIILGSSQHQTRTYTAPKPVTLIRGEPAFPNEWGKVKGMKF